MSLRPERRTSTRISSALSLCAMWWICYCGCIILPPIESWMAQPKNYNRIQILNIHPIVFPTTISRLSHVIVNQNYPQYEVSTVSSRRSMSSSNDHDTTTTTTIDHNVLDEYHHSKSRNRCILNRRDTLLLLSALLLTPMASSTASASTNHRNDDPLEQIRLGVGRWQSISTDHNDFTSSSSSTLLQQSTYSPTFCTYAARFLIRYDANVNAWWTDVVASTKPFNDDNNNNNNKAQQILQKNFGSFAKSLERAFCGIPSSALYENFLQTYNTNNDSDVGRQIAILFTLLPVNQQPTSPLDDWYKINQSQRSSWSYSETSMDGIDTWQPLNEIELLPDYFHVQKIQGSRNDPIAFVLQPSLPMYDTWMMDNTNEPNAVIMTAFGPMGTQSLIRDVPHYSWHIYALLGIAGATSCALTHTVVIPLDGTI